ncbi:MAG: heavy metal-binding domain-containing protein, partial [Myxococcaceae bacterium]
MGDGTKRGGLGLWGAVVVALLVGLGVGGGAVLLLTHGDHGKGGGEAAHGPRYVCPMHPEVTSDGPSNCPICGMKLVPIEGSARPAEVAVQSRYQCPMHPEVTSDGPSDCPVCGMKLVPVEVSA